MTPEGWSILSAIGSLVAGVAALLGLPFIGWQVRAARKTSDLQALQSFSTEMQKCEERLLAAKCEKSREAAFNDLLNLLELNAAALNAGLFPRTTRRLAREKIRDSLLVIESAKEWHSKFLQSITTETTFSEILLFIRSEKKYLRSARITPHDQSSLTR